MRDTNMIIHAERTRFLGGRIGLLIGIESGTDWSVAKPIEFQTIPRGSLVTPALTLDPTAAQQLMDELWNCGVRPTEGTGSAGSLAATQAHLKDMRSIAMGMLKQHGVDQT